MKRYCTYENRKGNANMDNSIYEENGYKDRADYLESLSDEYGVALDVVEMMAEFLGPKEDFDGLVANINDLFI